MPTSNSATEAMPSASKLSTDGAMIELLFERGRAAARDWLKRHFEALGKRSTIDIQLDYVTGMAPAALGVAGQKDRKRA